jgi:hypothetical protein
VDKEGRYYLMIENVVVNHIPNDLEDADGIGPYRYYYKAHYITHYDEQDASHYMDIQSFFIGGNRFNLSYHPNPEKDYDRISKWDDNDDGEPFGCCMEIEYKDGRRESISRERYAEILNNYGLKKGYSALNVHDA